MQHSQAIRELWVTSPHLYCGAGRGGKEYRPSIWKSKVRTKHPMEVALPHTEKIDLLNTLSKEKKIHYIYTPSAILSTRLK